ncbi:MAG: 30S ribosomal protein S12 methylthiotransferase RimO [Clostridia bacterium]|nr:30S ribosomal protein S12 methylthiotransferase RimO [Clostridia bacterium]
MSTRVAMISLGCPKNQVEAERMLAMLADAGCELVGDTAEAQVAVINTCGFIDSAKQEAIDHILEMAALKEEGLRGIVVTGCLAERYREQIREQIPEVDVVLGGGSVDDIVEAVESAARGEGFERYADIERVELGGDRLLTTPFYTAYLKLGDGCDNFCTYCAIPLIRGRLRSRSIEELLQEARALAEGGVRELVLVAQDTTRYGEDLYGENRLVELLQELERVEGIEWIRILYAYPDRVSDRLLDCMAASKKVLPYIDLPLQHCDDQILTAMNRRSDRKEIEDVLRRVREKLPNACVRTTFICGFPGESEEQFESLCDFVKAQRFDRMGCFAYSAEEGTPAAEFPNQIPEEEKQRRVDLLMLCQNLISTEINQTWVGRRLTVLVEEYEEEADRFVGRSYRDAPEVDGRVYFESAAECEIGSFVEVMVTAADDYDLYGTVCIE